MLPTPGRSVKMGWHLLMLSIYISFDPQIPLQALCLRLGYICSPKEKFKSIHSSAVHYNPPGNSANAY